MAVYIRQDGDELFTAYGVMVLAFADDRIVSMFRFVGDRMVTDCDLPMTVPA